jgi:hypothetical protein
LKGGYVTAYLLILIAKRVQPSSFNKVFSVVYDVLIRKSDNLLVKLGLNMGLSNWAEKQYYWLYVVFAA